MTGNADVMNKMSKNISNMAMQLEILVNELAVRMSAPIWIVC